MVAKTTRWLAPMALLAVAAGVYLLVHNALVTHDHRVASTTSTTFGTRSPASSSSPPARLPKYYVVRSGDTLSGIAHSTHVPLTTLESLNPSVSPNSLQTGQRLRLRR